MWSALVFAIPMCIGGQKGSTSACQVAEKLHTQDNPIRIEEVNNSVLLSQLFVFDTVCFIWPLILGIKNHGFKQMMLRLTFVAI